MKVDNNIRVGIIGGSGYTGQQLISLLIQHPKTDLIAVSSRELLGKKVQSIFSESKFDLKNLKYLSPKNKIFYTCDAVFIATPNGTSMNIVESFRNNGTKIIDLSSDFRIKDLKVWEETYGMKHSCPKLQSSFIYGLTELNEKEIRKSELVAVPGCYPTAVILALLPILKSKTRIISFIADVKSGISGAGRKVVESGLKKEIKNNFKAYSVDGHRHYPEIQGVITDIYNKNIDFTFIPHLLPIFRGIYATIYVTLDVSSKINFRTIYESFYSYGNNVILLEEGIIPEIAQAINTNKFFLSLNEDLQNNKITLIACMDNLMKGAAGQALECFNLMFNFDKNLGIN